MDATLICTLARDFPPFSDTHPSAAEAFVRMQRILCWPNVVLVIYGANDEIGSQSFGWRWSTPPEVKCHVPPDNAMEYELAFCVTSPYGPVMKLIPSAKRERLSVRLLRLQQYGDASREEITRQEPATK